MLQQQGLHGTWKTRVAWPSHWEHYSVSSFVEFVLVSLSVMHLCKAHSCSASVSNFLSNLITITLLTVKQSHKYKRALHGQTQSKACPPRNRSDPGQEMKRCVLHIFLQWAYMCYIFAYLKTNFFNKNAMYSHSTECSQFMRKKAEKN